MYVELHAILFDAVSMRTHGAFSPMDRGPWRVGSI
jgi:hypothetical protein